MGDATDESQLLDRYFGNNEQPTSQELERIALYTAGPREEILAINIEMRTLEARLASLRKTREDLKLKISKHTAISSIVRRLPDDILGEIFAWCLPQDRYPALHVADAPLLLTLISRRWRTVALRKSSLWAAAYLAIPATEQRWSANWTPAEVAEEQETPRAMIELFFSRAGALPLSLSLYDSQGHSRSKETSPAWKWVTTSLFPRVKRLELKGTSGAGDDSLSSLPVESFAQLESLNFCWPSEESNTRDAVIEVSELPSIFRAPKLRELELSYAQLDPAELPLQWDKLTRLVLKNHSPLITTDAATLILQKCSRLESCTIPVQGTCYWSHEIQGVPPPDPVAISERSIPLPFLETLHIYHQCEVEDFTRQLHIPMLKRLGFTYGDDTDVHVGRTCRSIALPNFLRYHEYNLAAITELEISFSMYKKSEIIEGLERLPNLRHMVLPNTNGYSSHSEDRDFDDAILRLMTPTMQEDPSTVDFGDGDLESPTGIKCLCPLLARLELRDKENWRRNRHLPLPALVDFLTAKWSLSKRFPGVVAPLLHLTVPARTIPDSTTPDKDVRGALKRWRKEHGLVLEVAYPYFDAEKQPEQYEGLEMFRRA